MEKTPFIHSRICENEIIYLNTFIKYEGIEWSGSYEANISRIKHLSVEIPSTEGLKELCFVHGSYTDLINGKICVIRDFVEKHILSNGSWSDDQNETCERYCVHLSDGHVVLVLGYTGCGNSKIVYK